MRRNGAANNYANSGATTTAGNFSNNPLYIGRRGGTSAPLNGRLYSLIIRGAATNAQQIAQTEGWVNSKTKAY